MTKNSWEKKLIRWRDWDKILSTIAPETVEAVKALEDKGFTVCVVEPGTRMEFESGSSSSSIAWFEKSWWVVAGQPTTKQTGTKRWSAGTAGGFFIVSEVVFGAGDAVAEEVWDGTGMELRIRRKVYVAVP